MTDQQLDVATQRAARIRERRHVLLVIVLLPVVAFCAGVGTWVFTSGAAFTGPMALVLAILLALVTVGAGIVLAFVWWRRRRGSALFARSPLWELPSYRQRSRFVKALRRGDPIPPELHDLGVRVARDVVRRRNLVWLWIGLAVLQGANAYLQDGWARWLAAAAALAFLGCVGYYLWLMGRMRSALARLESSAPTATGDRDSDQC